jgi:pterin-4a-carbinolamine dehydratase
VPLPHGGGEAVIEEIHRISQELDHHAQLKQGPEDLTLTLWTHSRDGVTELDVQLADRIHGVLKRL